MKIFKILFVTFVILGLSACNNVKPNISVHQDFWKDKNANIGVAVVEIPLPTAHKSGSQGLLDLAINNAAAGDLETHLNSLDTKEITQLATKITEYLKSNGYRAKQFRKPISLEGLPEFEKTSSGNDHYAGLDFTSYKTKYGIDKLLVIKVVRLGTIRSYYGFIPTSEPSGLSHINGQVINLTSNKLEWNQTVEQRVPNLEESWDVPPNFPGLTKAMYAALSQSRQMLFNNFAQ